MHHKEQLKSIYNNHIIKAELSVMDAYENDDPAITSDEVSIAIHHLQSAKTKLELIRVDIASKKQNQHLS